MTGAVSCAKAKPADKIPASSQDRTTAYRIRICSLRLIFDLKHLQTERPLQHTVHPGNRGQCPLDGRGKARLSRHNKGQAVLRITSPLQQRINIRPNLGERTGDGKDDPRLVVNDKAKIVRSHKVTGNLAPTYRQIYRLAALRHS